MDSEATAKTCSAECPEHIRKTLDIIAGKWASPIYLALYFAQAPLRYAQLQRQLRDITPKELAKHLRSFEEHGLLTRQVHATAPPSVEYSLTDAGRNLYPVFQAMAGWGELHDAPTAMSVARD